MKQMRGKTSVGKSKTPFWIWLIYPFLFLIALLILPFLPAMYLVNEFKKWKIIKQVRREWLPNGKKVLFVYSNSPNWQSYIEKNILPRLGSSAVLMNWSERKIWKQKHSKLENAVFNMWAGGREVNPLAIVFNNLNKPLVVRFYEPFKAFKHGKPKLLKDSENKLFEALSE